MVRLRFAVVVLVAVMLPAAGLAGIKAAKTKEPFWKPFDFGGGVSLDYDWVISQLGRKQQMKLTLEFRERYDYNYDILATLNDNRSGTVTESGVSDLFSWSLAKLEKSPVVPTQKNLPMVSVDGLVIPTIMLLFPTSTGNLNWEKGFTMAHPNLPDTTITGTARQCSAGGMKGKLITVKSPQGMASACISGQLGLPLSFKGTDTAGNFSKYTLLKYESRKLQIRSLFYSGEPTGFGGIKWKTMKKRVKGLKFLRDNSADSKVYRKKKDDLRSWGVPFESFEYHFWNGKFAQVTGKVRGDRNWELLIETLFKKYGRGRKVKYIILDGVESFVWDAGNVTNITIERAYGTDEGTLTISSLEMMWGDTQKEIQKLFE